MMTTLLGKRCRVRVRLLTDPCLWCWEISTETGEIVESSWSCAWMAYDSPEEALVAGQARLAELTSTPPRGYGVPVPDEGEPWQDEGGGGC